MRKNSEPVMTSEEGIEELSIDCTDALTVAIFSVGELFGGVERHILSLSTGLRHLGVTPVLMVLHDGDLAAQARNLGLKTIIIERRGRFDPATGERLADCIKTTGAHLIHVHGYQAAVFAALAARKIRLAVVVTLHGRVEGTWKEPLAYLKTKSYELLELTAVRLMKPILCYVTRDLETQNRRRHAGLRRHVIYNGVGLVEIGETTRPIEYDLDKLNVACVGRLSEIKGLEYALGAMTHEDMPRNAVLSIIGRGPLEKKLELQINRMGLAGRVRLLGFRQNVMDYIGKCDVLLMPSLHEGLPYTLLEAMAVGIPIVASDVGGLAEVLGDKVTAILVKPRDAAAIASAIKWIQENRESASAVSRTAQLEQRRRFGLNSMCQAYIDTYKEAVRSKR